MEDNLEAEYTLRSLHPSLVRNQWHTVPASFLGTRAPNKVSLCAEEISAALDDYLGQDTDHWAGMPVLDTMAKIAVRSANRLMFGEHLCRNTEVVDSVVKFGFSSFSTAAMIRILPDWLKPVLGPVLALQARQYHASFERILLPIVDEKIKATIPREKTRSIPNTDDMIQWHIDYTSTFGPEDDLTADLITKRLLMLCIGAMVTPAMGLTHLIFNLFSKETADLIPELRNEVLSSLEDHHGEWSIGALNRMSKLDSAIKESLRISCFGTRVCARRVLPTEGVTFRDGTHLPHNATVSVPQWQVHHDEKLYPDAHTYKPLRFYNPGAPSGITATTPEYLAFGIGRHACPARALAAIELKIVAAIMILKYDVAPIETKSSSWLGPSYIPSRDSIQVKRRKVE